MKRIFLDTAGIIALLNRDDQWHVAARGAIDAISPAKFKFVTTPMVLMECGNAVSRTTLRVEVCALRRKLQESKSIIAPSAVEQELAWRNFELGIGGQAGIVDQVSFILMNRLNIQDVFTHDRHFEAAGFKTLF